MSDYRMSFNTMDTVYDYMERSLRGTLMTPAETERKDLSAIKNLKDRESVRILVTRIKELKEAKDAAEAQLPELVAQATLLMAGHDVKSLAYLGKYFTVTDGKNVTYSKARVADAMLEEKIRAEVIERVLEKAKAEKKYTTLTMTTPKED